MSISQWIENRKKWLLFRLSIGDKLVDTKNVLVMKYQTLRQGGEGVVNVAPMMNFHLLFLFNQLFQLSFPLFCTGRSQGEFVQCSNLSLSLKERIRQKGHAIKQYIGELFFIDSLTLNFQNHLKCCNSFNFLPKQTEVYSPKRILKQSKYNTTKLILKFVICIKWIQEQSFPPVFALGGVEQVGRWWWGGGEFFLLL